MARKYKKKPSAITGQILDNTNMVFDPTNAPPRLPESSPVAPLPNESTDTEVRPRKRLKIDQDSLLSASLTEASIMQDPALAVPKDPANGEPTALLLFDIKRLQGEFGISTISVISSSKISQKVKTLLDRVEKSTFAGVDAKPGIAVVEAKAAVASKMISIIEIAKADIAKRGGKWYEYTKLRSELSYLKPKQKKKQQTQSSRTLVHRESGQDATGIAPQPSIQTVANDLGADEAIDPEDEGEAFETMQQPFGNPAMSDRAKVRAIPVMTIYFACVPIPELRELYG
ncbi:MAG: hypothetical protein Q9216_004387 [Gyalolechia sp. 2 TL-2023]